MRTAVGGWVYGSPPRAWGQLSNACAVGFVRGGSPPRAWGQLTDAGIMPASRKVHPHGRGDNSVRRRWRMIICGSPPRAWGQRGVGQRFERCLRFTPTGVGTTSQRQSQEQPKKSVHPHGRGDNMALVDAFLALCGSPPRAWGQRVAAPREGDRFRFTPTGVGTTRCGAEGGRQVSVHPHGRGDNCLRRCARETKTRFTPTGVGTTSIKALVALVEERFTPTGVGTTQNAGQGRRQPHGSPPRAWGQRQRQSQEQPKKPVHPHGRGDNGN